MDKKITDDPIWYWHIHPRKLYGYLNFPLSERIACIERSESEDRKTLHLRLLRPIVGELPNKLIEAARVCIKRDKIWSEMSDAYRKASADYTARGRTNPGDYNKAWYASISAWHELMEEWHIFDGTKLLLNETMESLHRQECSNCPWDGKSIF